MVKEKMSNRWKNAVFIVPILLLGFVYILSTNTVNAAVSAATQGGRMMKAADPSIISSNGQYYGVYVSGGSLYVKKSSSVAGLGTATAQKIWSKSGASEVWAPEIVKYNGQYLVYFTYGAGAAHRMYVISSSNPDSGYGAETPVVLPDNKWAIDGTLFTYNNETWFTWSGWEGDVNGQQNIYVARMSDTTTSVGPRYVISKPTASWEKMSGGSFGLPYVNEAPQPVVDPNGQLHMGFSANGYWSQYYCIADLRLKVGGDITNIADWYKTNGCLFSSKSAIPNVGTLATRSKGTGHHSFILPDGDANQGPALGETKPFAYHGVPSGTIYLPDYFRYWYWGNMSWQPNVSYSQGTATDSGLAPKYYE